jgi:hypothetical protein
MEATVRNVPSARYFSDAAIDFAVTEFADEAVTEVKSTPIRQYATLSATLATPLLVTCSRASTCSRQLLRAYVRAL